MDLIIVASILNFLVVLAVLWHFLRKPASEMLHTRSKTLASSIEEAEKLATDAGAFLTQWKTRWHEAEADAKRQRDEAEKALERAKVTAIAAAQTEAARIQKEAQMVGNSEVEKAKDSLLKEVLGRSIAVARHYLRTHLEDKTRKSLTHHFMETPGNGSAR